MSDSSDHAPVRRCPCLLEDGDARGEARRGARLPNFSRLGYLIIFYLSFQRFISQDMSQPISHSGPHDKSLWLMIDVSTKVLGGI
jgi:hypothetical protein